MVKGRLFLLVTTVSAWATPSAVLEPREGTPCLSSCENPSNDSCKLCCGQVKHEVDWKCGAASSDDKAACCENWKEQCWNVASDQNLGHACNQCRGIAFTNPNDFLLLGAAPSDGDGDGNDDDKDSDTSDDSSDSDNRRG